MAVEGFFWRKVPSKDDIIFPIGKREIVAIWEEGGAAKREKIISGNIWVILFHILQMEAVN